MGGKTRGGLGLSVSGGRGKGGVKSGERIGEKKKGG